MTAAAPRPGAVRYVRHKPGKTLHIFYRLPDHSMLCLTADERVTGPVTSRDIPALVALLADPCDDARNRLPGGVSVHRLPEDPGLPALHAAWNPVPGDELCRALEAMLNERSAIRETIVGIAAIPRHYKPGSRCVIEYRLDIQPPDRGSEHGVVVYGKLFAKLAQAQEMDAALRRVEAACDPEGMFARWTPRALGVCEALNMSVTAAAGEQCASQSGMAVLRPRGTTPASRRSSLPTHALQLAASALAHLHSSSIAIADLEARTAPYEADRAIERGELIAAYHHGMERAVRDVARRTAASLAAQTATLTLPCHGSYKRSQLVYTGAGTLTVVDWDSMCAADPALDLGCFLAHLRPAAIWYGRRGARAWFDAAAACWIQAYAQEMTTRGMPPDVVSGIVSRSAAYEAATLLKMATRRLRRLNNPRPQELRSMLAEADCCLSADAAA